jgi:hypothetical protein
MLDPLLARFVEAPDPASAEKELDDLVEHHVVPMAEAIVARKLRAFPGAETAFEMRDQHDVVSDALTTLVDRLWRLRAGDGEPIVNFESYAATVVRSACAHEIRRRHPQRARLKNRLRYIFSTDPRLALWMSDDELVCGRAQWRGRPIDRAAQQTVAGGHIEEDCLAMDRGRLTRAVVDLVDKGGGPTGFDTLVAAASAHVVEPREVVDASLLAEVRAPDQDCALDQRRFLVQIWDEVGRLPVRQRLALLLNLRDPKGSGILWLLPIAGVATIQQIARVLEIPLDEFLDLWREIPIDDATIAARLGCTRQQVINFRVSARKRLLNRVGRTSDSGGRRQGRRGNLPGFSTSLKDDV